MYAAIIMGASYEPSHILVYCFIGATVAIVSLCLLVQSASVVVNQKDGWKNERNWCFMYN